MIQNNNPLFSPILDLEVPSVAGVRKEIRRKVSAYFESHPSIPPVQYAQLHDFATELIERNGWEERQRAFVMVCCGNEIWRPILGAIPFDRRIFLLPQCLRNTTHCKAQQDELGLLCSECGSCSISSLLREAENLGYVALVTEGTTITTRLIESGKVDAVIGVGCMEVLRKMFASVSKYAIPSIGIPLITCGCSDTLADTDWIKSEIYYHKADPSVKLLNLNFLRNKTASVFGNEQLERMMGSTSDPTRKMAIESLLSGGQRIRPFLTVLAYEAYVEEPDNQLISTLALIVECFHKASLIHDDIEDGDQMRYGKDTLHASYGIPMALNAGDYLLGEGYHQIASSGMNASQMQKALRHVSFGHKQLTLGQGIELAAIRDNEILSVNDMLRVFEFKTSAAFRVSLLLGASVAGAPDDQLELLDQFSRSIGIAYQIKDDLQDYQGDQGDIANRRFSIVLSLLADHLRGESAGELIGMPDGDYTALHQLIDQHAILPKTIDLLHHYLGQTRGWLDQLPNIGLKLALHEIVGKVFKDYL